MYKKTLPALIILILSLALLWFRVLAPKKKKLTFQGGKIPFKARTFSSPSFFPKETEQFKMDSKELLLPVYQFLPKKSPGLSPLNFLSYDPFKLSPEVLRETAGGINSFTLTLSAIILVNKEKIAIINKKQYREGDMIGPVLVKKIGGNRVYIQTPLGEDYMELYTDRSKINLEFPSPASRKGGKK